MSDDVKYLGDGLYAAVSNGMVKLMANHHEHPTDTVYLDTDTLKSFEHFIVDARAKKAIA